VHEAATIVGVSAQEIYAYCKRGELAYNHHGRRITITRADLDELPPRPAHHDHPR
jgi:excisionase family DNA binding protein